MGQFALSRAPQQNTFKSLFLVALMITMSLSAGIIDEARSTSSSEGLEHDWELSTITGALSDLNPFNWFDEGPPVALDSSNQEPMMTGGRSAPAISYSPNVFDLTQNIAMSTVTPTVAGTVTSWSISPSLPNGLSLSSTNGAISGTPTAISSTTNYTITASNSGGSDTATVTITVSEPLPVIAYNPNSFTLSVGTAMTSVSPTLYGTGTVDSYSISPSLPAGLSIGTTTGTIGGTPTAVSSSATYTITATNTAGSDTATITIVVNDVAPSSITYSPNTFTLTKGTAMTTTTPTTTGGTVTTWSISPALPSGLSLGCLGRCHQWNAHRRLFFSDLHHHRDQHRWKCDHDHHHRRQRCRPNHWLFEQFGHADERDGHDHAQSDINRWNRCFMVCFSVASSRPEHFQHHRCHFRYANSGDVFGHVHHHGHQHGWN